MHGRTLVLLTAVATLAIPLGAAPATSAPDPVVHHGAASHPSGSFALSGPAAERFVLPPDLVVRQRSAYPDDVTATRYQQVVSGASVIGSQVTVLRSASGVQQAVIGRYADAVRPVNDVRLTGADARRIGQGRVGAAGTWKQELRLDPASGRFVHELTSTRAGSMPLLWIDAADGGVRRSVDLARTGDGTGVKGDTKVVATTRVAQAAWLLRSPDGRQLTYDAQNRKPGHRIELMVDANDRWDLRANWVSPDQRAGVDAHYYAGVVDRFYGEVFGRDSIDGEGGAMLSIAHVDKEMCNAFWDGSAAFFGDGLSPTAPKPAATTCKPLSGALDLVAHEFTHGVVQHTSRLFFGPESTALGEGFSDVMGAAVEFYAAANGLDPAAPPDWAFAEDVVGSASSTPGFRNLAEPRLLGDLDHYSQLGTTTVPHARGTIAGHAFHLASVGGRNSGCVASASQPATHTADCAVVVPAIGVSGATDAFFRGITALHETAGFCDARNATVAVAGSDATAIGLAWEAVGVGPGCTPTPPPAPACDDVPVASVPFESTHPYADDSACTWTFDNGTGGFAFHFALLDVEADYDFVDVLDASGAVLGRYTGNFGADAPLTCIPTSVGSVRLTSDSSVTAQGFVVDAVVPC